MSPGQPESLTAWEMRPLAEVKIKGLGPRSKDKLIGAGVNQVLDLIALLPREYQDFTTTIRIADAPLETSVQIIGTVISTAFSRTANRKIPLFEILLDDDYGTLRVLWFGQPWMRSKISKGMRLSVRGKIRFDKLGRTMNGPRFEVMDDESMPSEGGVEPVYRQAGGLRSEDIAKWIALLIKQMPEEERLPQEVIEAHNFPPRKKALALIHQPPDAETLRHIKSRTHPALRRLAYEEFFLFQQKLADMSENIQGRDHPRFSVEKNTLDQFYANLPFQLTGDQLAVITQLFDDLNIGRRLHCLVQGDVGCGKTVVGFAIAILAAIGGYQSALMCPTTVLAYQHFETAQKLLADTGVRVTVMTRRNTTAEIRERVALTASGEIDLVIGTHKIFQDNVSFHKLGLVMIDEQHRFGVEQRGALLKKGQTPHYLAFSATPIPRSLAMTLYADYQVLQIREKPAERAPVRTILKKVDNRAEVIKFAHGRIARGESVFWVFPLIEGDEEDEEKQQKSAEAMYQSFANREFRGHEVGMVHGRMDKDDVAETMTRFKNGQTKVLVATTVIEVGVDVPQASIMVVESADHFGLSQLHQLRGRVGRGNMAAFCFLMVPGDIEGGSLKRMRLLERSNDGFEIAEFDLKQRGFGELLGKKQSGWDGFRFSDPWLDRDLMQDARARVGKTR